MCFFSYGQSNTSFKEGKIFDPVLLDSGNDIEVKYQIQSKIEIDGHASDLKIGFTANLEGIEIIDEKGGKYKRRKCEKEKCELIHLEKINEGYILLPSFSRIN